MFLLTKHAYVILFLASAKTGETGIYIYTCIYIKIAVLNHCKCVFIWTPKYIASSPW